MYFDDIETIKHLCFREKLGTNANVSLDFCLGPTMHE